MIKAAAGQSFPFLFLFTLIAAPAAVMAQYSPSPPPAQQQTNAAPPAMAPTSPQQVRAAPVSGLQSQPVGSPQQGWMPSQPARPAGQQFAQSSSEQQFSAAPQASVGQPASGPQSFDVGQTPNAQSPAITQQANAAQQPAMRQPRQLQQPLYRVAATPAPPTVPGETAVPTPPDPAGAATGNAQSAAAEHPLTPALRWAKEGLPHIQALADYSCILHKRELVDGQLTEHQAMFVKVRHQPFSVYMYFLSPPNLKGQEVIYVDGQNDNKLNAHGVGIKGAVGTVSLHPEGHMAMRGNRYPITELGVLRLVQRLIEVGDHDSQYGECEVNFLKAKISGRPSTCIQVVHPTPRRNFLFHLARIYVDDELNIPIRYEAWDWPARAGGPPQLMEEYTYQNIKMNNGFTDLDFDVKNPKYGFR